MAGDIGGGSSKGRGGHRGGNRNGNGNGNGLEQLFGNNNHSSRSTLENLFGSDLGGNGLGNNGGPKNTLFGGNGNGNGSGHKRSGQKDAPKRRKRPSAFDVDAFSNGNSNGNGNGLVHHDYGMVNGGGDGDDDEKYWNASGSRDTDEDDESDFAQNYMNGNDDFVEMEKILSRVGLSAHTVTFMNNGITTKEQLMNVDAEWVSILIPDARDQDKFLNFVGKKESGTGTNLEKQ